MNLGTYHLLVLLLINLISAVLTGCGPAPEVETRSPNIVVILADDLGYGDIGYYNAESKIPTPFLDRLASQGMTFLDAHSPSSVCTPTRYGLLTGRYSWRTQLESGVLWGYSPCLIEQGRTTIASALQTRGYRTAALGKWHLGLGSSDPTDYFQPLIPGPLDFGFESFFGIPASLDMDPYLFVEGNRAEEFPTSEVDASGHRRVGGGGFWRAGAAAPNFRHDEVLPRIADRAVRQIQQMASDSPYFLYIAFTAPHTPWLPLEKFRDTSGAGYYGDFCVQVDSVVGQILAAIDETGQAASTLVVFTSDNGAHWPRSDIERFSHRANGPWRGQKADIWEGGHRVPFIVRWPELVQAGGRSEQLVSLTDLFATVCDIVEHELGPEEAEDSFSFLPILKGATVARGLRQDMVHHSMDGMFAIREGSKKLIMGRGSGGFTEPRRVTPAADEPEGQLYDLAADPSEEQNLYLEDIKTVERLKSLLKRCREQPYTREMSHPRP